MSVERFFLKTADIASALPMIALPAIGGYAGGRLGGRLLGPTHGPDLGKLIGGISGAVGGVALSDNNRQQGVPPGAPYALDPTDQDIPPWALQGAQMLQPLLKQGGHFGDVVGSDVMGAAWPVVEGVRKQESPGQIAKNVGGQAVGTFGGGLAGHALGGLVDRAAGHQVMGPLGVPLSTLLAGLGATIGNVKGLEFTRR